jgi:hypothetical protein
LWFSLRVLFSRRALTTSALAKLRVVVRSFGLLAACLVVVAQLANTLHFALVPHHLCLEHGRFEHEDHAGPSAGVRQAREHGVALEAGGEDEHEECRVLARRSESLAIAPASSLDAARVAITVERVSISDEPLLKASAVVLLFAPKQSPPV